MSPDAGPPAGAGVTFGIDIGGTKVLGVALDPDDDVVADARVPTPRGNHDVVGSHVAEAVAQVVAELDRETGASGAAPVGVGAPGMVDRRGRLCFAPNLPQAQGVDWTELIGGRLPGRRVLVENDANFAVLAEHRLGAARAHDDVVMVTLGTGIGGGIVTDGRVQVGSAGFAGEIGHMVVDPAGPACPCGRRGCWERFASGAGLGVLAREAALAGRLGEVVRLAGGDPESVRGEDVSAAAAVGRPGGAAGDPRGRVVDRFRPGQPGLRARSGLLRPRRRGGAGGGPPDRRGPRHLRRARRGRRPAPGGGDRPRRLRGTGRRGRRGAGGAPGWAVVMRTGVVLPTFRDRPDEAFDAAAEAMAAGVDGVFCYDHIWPLGQPERPALAPFPVLGALATRLGPRRGAGEGPFLGTLVARIGLAPNAVLAAQFGALERLAPGRVIAGLGTGDRLSEEENKAYGIPFPPAAERRAQLVALGRALAAAGLTVWVAGGTAGRTEEARAAGAALNVWDADPTLVAERASGPDGVEVTWAGPPPTASPTIAETVRALHDAGATWAVFGWPVDVEHLVAAARAADAGPSSGGSGTGP